jgi:hypothetical protein
MDLIPLLIPLARVRLQGMTPQEKDETLRLVRYMCDVLLTGDREQISTILDRLTSDSKVKKLVLDEFASSNQV